MTIRETYLRSYAEYTTRPLSLPLVAFLEVRLGRYEREGGWSHEQARARAERDAAEDNRKNLRASWREGEDA